MCTQNYTYSKKYDIFLCGFEKRYLNSGAEIINYTGAVYLLDYGV